ncbi:hypothetical protein BC628DRAFT_1166670 [Trametes gibbosa]|nr:hypothetical protein BC628DRAFT_1166670 [Trametes gibbosa]
MRPSRSSFSSEPWNCPDVCDQHTLPSSICFANGFGLVCAMSCVRHPSAAGCIFGARTVMIPPPHVFLRQSDTSPQRGPISTLRCTNHRTRTPRHHRDPYSHSWESPPSPSKCGPWPPPRARTDPLLAADEPGLSFPAHWPAGWLAARATPMPPRCVPPFPANSVPLCIPGRVECGAHSWLAACCHAIGHFFVRVSAHREPAPGTRPHMNPTN